MKLATRAALVEQLKRHEGTIKHGAWHRVYVDSVGKRTIGYGRNLDDKGLADDEAEFLLYNDVEDALKDAHILHFYAELSENRKQVIANMVFNMGLTRVLGFKRMIAAIDAGDFEEAARQMLDSRWAAQVFGRAQELAKMMREG